MKNHKKKIYLCYTNNLIINLYKPSRLYALFLLFEKNNDLVKPPLPSRNFRSDQIIKLKRRTINYIFLFLFVFLFFFFFFLSSKEGSCDFVLLNNP